MIDVLPAQLLGRHVGDGAKDGPFPGQPEGLRDLAVLCRFGLGQLGQPEVEDLHVAVIRDHHVGRLEIPVDDALRMGCSQCIGDRSADLEDFRQGQPVGREDLVQALAFDQFHGEEADALVFLDRVHVDDVRVAEAGDGLRLALESFEAARIGGEIGGEDLQGDVAVQLRVAGAVDLTHPALADEGGDLVVGEGLADQFWAPGEDERRVYEAGPGWSTL